MASATSNNSTLIPNNVNPSSNDSAIAQLVPIAVLIVLINGLVLLLFAKEKRLRTPTNYLLFSLAVCDFMTGFINIPLFIIWLARVVAPPSGKILGFFLPVLHNLVVVLVVYHIFAITAERYFSIIHPFRHRWEMTKKFSLKIIGFIWLAALTIVLLPITWFTRFLKSPQNAILPVTLKIQTGHTVFCIIFVFVVPYVFIVYFQVVMFKKIAHKTTKFDGTSQAESLVHRKAQDSKRCLIIFALMAFLCAICWFPWFVVSLLTNLWFPLSEETKRILLKFSHPYLILRYLASIVNPVLYTFLKRDFLVAFNAIILRRQTQQSNSQPASLNVLARGHHVRASFPGNVYPENETVEDVEYLTVV